MKYYLAIDIGASSGRHIIGWNEENELKTEEVYRFSNGVHNENGVLTWDIEHVFAEVKAGIRTAFEKYEKIESLSIDTWGVDYVLIKEDEPVYPCYAYRDDRTKAVIPAVHSRISSAELYEHTGTQYQPYNTIYQLYADKISGRLADVTDFLMIPEYLMWRLSGVKAKEYTNATTTGLVNALTKEFDGEIIAKLELPESLFPKLSMPGTPLASLKPEIAAEVGGQTRVVLCATHDTASAVEGIPMTEDAPFLSSGTWSLLGRKLNAPIVGEKSRQHNFTNEGGAGYIRYLKNIMGLWIIQCLQKQIDMSFSGMEEAAKTSDFTEIFDVNDNRFLAPADMRKEIIAALTKTPATDKDLINSVYHSLAFSYGQAVRELEECTSQSERLYIAGGGAKNQYLNELTGRYTKKEIVPLPIEATALGNLKIQMKM